jgi:hypothetical protein
MTKKELGKLLFDLIAQDLKKQGLPLRKTPKDYFLSHRAIFYLKKGEFSLDSLTKYEEKFNIKINITLTVESLDTPPSVLT